MEQNKITPALWYHTEDGNMQYVLNYYEEIFDDNFGSEGVIPLGKTPSGNAEMCEVKFFGQEFLIMTTEIEHHKFNDTFAIMLHCKDQQEIDKYWDYFTQEGEESMCGWCKDKFGLRWQVIPDNIAKLMSKPNAGQVMSRQRKIIIAEYLE